MEGSAKPRGSCWPCSPSWALGPGHPVTEPGPYERTRHPIGLRRRLPPPQLLQTGLVSLQGVRDGTRGWREKGKSLGGRRAGPAASRSRGSHRAARSLAPRLAPTRARPAPGPAPQPGGAAALRTRPGSAGRRGCAGRGAVPRGWGFGARSLPSLTKGLTGGGGRGKRGHTPAAARAHCTLAAARPRRGASGASLAPRLGPQHLRALRAAPRPRPGPAPGRPTPLQPLAPPVRTALPSPGKSNNTPITCRLWRNWSRQRRRPNAARVR